MLGVREPLTSWLRGASVSAITDARQLPGRDPCAAAARRRRPAACSPPATRAVVRPRSIWPLPPWRCRMGVLDDLESDGTCRRAAPPQGPGLHRPSRDGGVAREAARPAPGDPWAARPCGQIPTIGGATIQTRAQQVHAGLFAALYARYAGPGLRRQLAIRAVIAAYDLTGSWPCRRPCSTSTAPG